MFDEFIEDFEEAEQIGANLLAQKDDGSCIYLDNKLCLIHDKRPDVCKPFFCSSKEEQFKEMIRIIKEKQMDLNSF